MGESFKGIERYLGTDVVRTTAIDHSAAGITHTLGTPALFELAPARTSNAKQLLQQSCAARNNPDDVEFLIDALEWLESQIPRPTTQITLPGL